jgi:hypothetical protein
MSQATRRQLLQDGAALLALGALPSAQAASHKVNRPGGARSDRATALAALADPAQRHAIYRRMRYAGHQDVFYWWLRGTRYGLIDNELTPFFRMEVGSMHRCQDLGNGRYSVTSLGLIYFTDLQTGELLEKWPNPVTGKTVDFSYPRPGPRTVVYGPEGIESEPGFPAAGALQRHELSAPDIVGDDLWLNEASQLTAPAQSNGMPALRVHDMYALRSPVAALLDPRQQFVPCHASFNDFNTWSPRFQMGDRPGTSLSRCQGRKEASLDALPPGFLALAQRLHPQLLADPAAALTPEAKS